MFVDNDWHDLFNKEISEAVIARKNGNEGLARVCARRAAGIVIREYYDRSDTLEKNQGAYDLLLKMSSQQDIEEDIREVVNHFLARITPEKTLPIHADLIMDAHWLAERLIK